ncbi:hypothetical protein BT69DRAFT_1247910 [Atractiella rhizophila]|nr:hypothetical protein BT69DRAFT_1247910 [Atractiella rhizophila]
MPSVFTGARFQPRGKVIPSFYGVNAPMAIKWVPTLGIWGVGATAALFLFMSDIPVFKQDVLLKIPILKNHYEDKIPASDKPF